MAQNRWNYQNCKEEELDENEESTGWDIPAVTARWLLCGKSAGSSEGKLCQSSLHKIRVSHPGARWKEAIYFGIYSQRQFATVSDSDATDALQRGAVWRGSIQRASWAVR